MATTATGFGVMPDVLPAYAPWYPFTLDTTEPLPENEPSDWDRAVALAQKGYAARAAGDLGRAAPSLRKALSLFGTLGDVRSAMPVYAALAETHFASGDYQEAAQVQREALALRPGNSLALIGLAYSEWYEGHFADALSLLSEAVMSASDQRPARRARGQLLADLGRASAALADLAGPVPAGDEPDIRSARAVALDALGRLEEADLEQEAALELGPSRPRTHWRIARIQERRGEDEAALQSLRRALTGEPPLPPAHAFQVRTLLAEMAAPSRSVAESA